MNKYAFAHRDLAFRNQIRSAVSKGLRDTTGAPRTPKALKFRSTRSSVIRPLRVGWEVQVPSGKGYANVKVTPPRVGCRFGQFAPTKAWFKPVVKKGGPGAKGAKGAKPKAKPAAGAKK